MAYMVNLTDLVVNDFSYNQFEGQFSNLTCCLSEKSKVGQRIQFAFHNGFCLIFSLVLCTQNALSFCYFFFKPY